MKARIAILGAVTAAFLSLGVTAVQGDPVLAVSPVLTYVTGGSLGPEAVWLAFADGTNAQRLGPGDQPLLSPDGSAVAASLVQGKGPALVVYRPGRRTQKYFDASKFQVRAVSWSPLSRYLAVELFSTNHPGGELAILDTRTATAKTIANGSICGASFAPDQPARLVYARGLARSMCFFSGVDIYSAAVDGTGVKRLTTDGRSLNPVWGAGGIAFDRQTPRHNDAPIYQVWLMNPDGSNLVPLTHMQIPSLVDGLVPLQFSGDGKRLLTEFVGQDTSETWTIDLATQRVRHLTVRKLDVQPGGLSLDGRTVLVDVGGFENPPSTGKLETMPFAGGHAKVIVAHGGQASWNR